MFFNNGIIGFTKFFCWLQCYVVILFHGEQNTLFFMNDNNLIKAQLWADVYGGTIKNGHSVAAATDRANEAVKEYEGRFDVSDGEGSNAELRRAVYLRDARIKQLEGRDAKGHRLLIEGAEILQARDANIRELKDQLKEAEACIADLGDRLKERESTVGSLSNLLSEKDQKISALEERVKQDKRREKSMFFVGDRIKAVSKDSVSPFFGTVVKAGGFILHVKPYNPEVLPDDMRHHSIIGVVRNDCERVLEFPSRNHLVKDVQTNDAANVLNPSASNLHPFVSENADKLAEASKDGGLFISNQIPINPSRRSGNTTRIVDAIIQALFNGEKVLVRDHYNSRETNRELLNKVEHRLVNDHGIKWSTVCMEVECLGGDVTIWLENRTGEYNK